VELEAIYTVGFVIIYLIENMYAFLVLILTLVKYQVSLLVPLLLLLYVNDIGCSISSSTIKLFADDKKFFKFSFMVNLLKICKLQLCMK